MLSIFNWKSTNKSACLNHFQVFKICIFVEKAQQNRLRPSGALLLFVSFNKRNRDGTHRDGTKIHHHHHHHHHPPLSSWPSSSSPPRLLFLGRQAGGLVGEKIGENSVFFQRFVFSWGFSTLGFVSRVERGDAREGGARKIHPLLDLAPESWDFFKVLFVCEVFYAWLFLSRVERGGVSGKV